MKTISFALSLVLPFAAAVSAGTGGLKPLEQWPQWRGPLANGVAPAADPPLHWDEKTNIKWKVELPGPGSATPIIWGDYVFIAVAMDTGRTGKPEEMPKFTTKQSIKKTTAPNTVHQFILICFERQTGKIRWQKVCAERVPHQGIQENNTYSSGSPTTDGKHVWVSFGSQGTYCFDFAGQLVWQRDLGFLDTRYGFGEAVTPTLHGDSLILAWDQEFNSKLIVLNAYTGKTRLEVDRDEPTTWTTPLVVDYKGLTQVILNGTKRVRSYDLATGKELWKVGGMTINPIPSAVAEGGVAYIMTGYVGSLAVAVPLDARGELTDTNKVAWKHTRGTPYIASPLLVDGKLYFLQNFDNVWTCLDARTGKPLIDKERLPGVKSFYASPVAAAGRIYLVDRNGVSLVLKQSSKVEVLATNKLDDHIDASPVPVGRQLFLRGFKYLYCVEQK